MRFLVFLDIIEKTKTTTDLILYMCKVSILHRDTRTYQSMSNGMYFLLRV